ncbi:hypothetical protein ACWIW6_05560 [Ursidibacter sp. B-7004-1]
MKKVITVAAIALFSLSTIAEAKRGGGMRVAKTKPSTQQSTSQQKNQQQDADFNNTPQQPVGAAQQVQSNGNRAANFLTGAAAGYLLSDMLSPTEAQAQENKQVENKQQAVDSTQQSVNPVAQLNQQVQNVPTVQAFKSIDPQDPNLIEKTAGYSRYCLNGVQYLISATNNQLPPTLMVDKNNAPVQCIITQ